MSAVLKSADAASAIATTERYYINLNASDIARELWQQFGSQPPVADASLQQSCNIPPVED